MSKNATILFAGDTFPVPANIELFRAGDIETLFGDRVCELFAKADYRICNLEGCLTDTGEPVEKIGPLVKAPTDSLNALKKLGLNAATLANTHTLDFGKTGHDEMRAALTRYGIAYFGTGDNASSISRYITLRLHDKTIILYTVTELFRFNTPSEDQAGAFGYDEYIVCRELAALKEQCDYLVVLYHGGVEMTHLNTPVVRRRFHRMADNGADIIISQHTHAVGFEERYNGAYLFYGQGNFCFNLSKTVSEYTRNGILLEVTFSDDGFSVNKHLVRRTELGCRYDENQDFTDFDERSRLHERLLLGDKEAQLAFEREYQRLIEFWIPHLLPFFPGIDPEDRDELQKKSSAEIAEYLMNRYTKQQLMGMYMMLTNDEINEIAVKILKTAIDKKE
ncbi:MAG: CapA family protein [Ruminococcus sp.]|nr:CapA family protein [Ruminococcus sp.]